MNTCAFLLILTVQIYADGIEGPTGKTSRYPHLLGVLEKFVLLGEIQLKGQAEGVRRGCVTLRRFLFGDFCCSGCFTDGTMLTRSATHVLSTLSTTLYYYYYYYY